MKAVWLRTNNPEREVWRYLSLFSNKSYIDKLVKEKAKDQIVSCVRQATEFYSLSKSASILTKPILLYYGMQRLAKALIFLKNPDVNVNDLRNHGLSGAGISDKIDEFLRSKIQKTRRGIFNEFCRLTTRNYALLKRIVYTEQDYHSVVNWIHECNIEDFLNATEFNVRDLFSLVPELFDLFDFLKMEDNLLISCTSLSIRERPNGKLDHLLKVEKKIDLDLLKRKFPNIGKYAEFNEESNEFRIVSRLTDELMIPNPLVQSETKDLFLISSTNDSTRMSDINVHYVLMFFLCYVTRYKAPLFQRIMESDKMSGLIEKFIEVSETKFPKLILDELTGQYITFELLG